MSNAESPTANDLDAPPLAYPVNTFAKAIGVGRSKIYEEIRNGRLRAKKLGGRTLIIGKDASEYLSRLPDVNAA